MGGPNIGSADDDLEWMAGSRVPPPPPPPPVGLVAEEEDVDDRGGRLARLVLVGRRFSPRISAIASSRRTATE